MSNLINTYIAGGVEYMHPITLLFLFNLGVITYVTFNYVNKKSIDKKWIESIKHVGGLALAVGTIGTLIGLFFAFDALEGSKEVIPFPVIMGGLKVALINILYGLFIFFISMIVYVAMKLKIRNKPVTS
jgi:biopolymer transport protein ExbB/TolQ